MLCTKRWQSSAVLALEALHRHIHSQKKFCKLQQWFIKLPRLFTQKPRIEKAPFSTIFLLYYFYKLSWKILPFEIRFQEIAFDLVFGIIFFLFFSKLIFSSTMFSKNHTIIFRCLHLRLNDGAPLPFLLPISPNQIYRLRDWSSW